MKKRLLSMLLAATLLVGLVPQAFAANDLDNHWAKPYMTYLAAEGVFKPSGSTGLYTPDAKVTRAEFMRYINRAFHFTETTSISYSDVSSTAWYYDTIRIAARYGYINGVGNNKMDPLGEMTREQAAVIIGRLYKEDPGDIQPSALAFSDKNQISTWSAGYIKAAADQGILSGYTDGTFRPAGVVTRAEVSKILYFYLGSSLSSAGKAYTGADLKSDTENVTISESCTLSDATIRGDLYLTEGLGSSAVTLTGVTVQGRIIVSGGTVNLVNTTCDHVIVASSFGRLLQATATGASHFNETVVRTNATLYETGLTTAGREGFAAVIVDGESRVSLTLDAALGALTLQSEATVSTTANAAIHHLTAAAAASITGYGSVYQADISAAGVSVAASVPVAGYTLKNGVTATIGGGTVSTSSAATVSPTKFSVDLGDLTALGAGVQVALPTGVKAASVTMDGVILSPSSAYTEHSAGILVLTSYLGTLRRGNHTLRLTLSDGQLASIAVTVDDTSADADAVSLTFDRYYHSANFADLAVNLQGVTSESQIRSAVLGLTRLDWDFNTATRKLVLRRGVLAGLRAGVYTVSVDLTDGTSRRLDLTVTDSSPAGTITQVAEYNTYEPVEASFSLDLSRLSVRSISAVKDGAAKTLTANTDYTVGNNTLTLSKSALERFRTADSCVPFTVTLSDNAVVTLVIDYI